MATTTIDARPENDKQYTAWGVLAWIGALHVGASLALLGLFYPGFFSWSAVAVCFFLHWVTGGLGITMTYHRLLTHRSFATRPKAFEYFLTILGCCASEGGAIGWVADHRRHHAFSDTDEDAHTPRRSFGWAHMFWFMTPDISSRHTPEYYQKWTPDLIKDKVHVFLDRWHLIFPIALFIGLYMIGGLPWLIWGGFLRTVLVLHCTWLVNSATHVWGYRTHETRDDSTNLWWVALITYGEGWHNNHHAYQTSARHGLAWWELDMTYMAIRGLSWVGLVDPKSIKMPKITRAKPAAAPAAPGRPVLVPQLVTKGLNGGDEPELAVAAN
jgi:fatty-acid desaturase